MSRPSEGSAELSVRVSPAMHERVFAAAAAEGLQATPWVRRVLLLALENPRLGVEHARFGATLELIASSRAVDPEVLRQMARVGLGR